MPARPAYVAPYVGWDSEVQLSVTRVKITMMYEARMEAHRTIHT